MLTFRKCSSDSVCSTTTQHLQACWAGRESRTAGVGFTVAVTAMNNLSCRLHRLYQILFQGLHTSAQPPFQLYLCFSPTPPSHISSSARTLLEMASLAVFAHSSCHLATHWRGLVRRRVTNCLCSRSGTLCPLRLHCTRCLLIDQLLCD